MDMQGFEAGYESKNKLMSKKTRIPLKSSSVNFCSQFEFQFRMNMKVEQKINQAIQSGGGSLFNWLNFAKNGE